MNSNGVWRDAVDMFSYTGPGQVKKKAMQIAWQGAPMRLTAEYTYNDEGRVATVKYPTTNTAGATYALSYDSMARVTGMTENGASLVSGVSYGAAGQMTAMSWAGWTETFSFNARMQMTRSTISGVYDEEYTFSATQNNGQITKKKDWISGEEVNYTYDSLNRMIAASTTGSGGWGSSYSYDGFGNLTAKTATKGTVPPLSVTVDAATNRLTGQSFDANGNQLTAPSGGTLAYDLANRVMNWGSVETYGYNPGNKRVLKTNTSTHVDTLFFYGLDGRRMGTYQLNGCPGGCYLSTISTEVYFKGRLVKSGNEAVVVDRLGSVRKRKNLSTSVVSTFDYWPYGEEKPSATANNKDKFGTYYRDSSSGLDYANQRYYKNENGRFMSVDPAGSGLNHYGYVGGDPVNRNDASGLDPEIVTEGSAYFTVNVNSSNPLMTYVISTLGYYLICESTGLEVSEPWQCPGVYGPPPQQMEDQMSGVVVQQSGGGSGSSAPGAAAAGMSAALGALTMLAVPFPETCASFLDATFGTGMAEALTLKAAVFTPDLIDANTVNAPYGSTLFPDDPARAATAQADIDKKLGLSPGSNATLSQVAQAFPNLIAWGQFKGSSIFVNAPQWSGWNIQNNALAYFTMMHELMHVLGEFNGLLMGDSQIMTRMGIPSGLGSQEISLALLRGCVGP